MAKRQFMSKRPPGRNPSSKKRASPRRPAADETNDQPDELIEGSLASSPLIRAIENERVRLLEVKCVLHCMYVAMLYDEGDPLEYADAAKISGRMISKALDQLDGARLQPLVGKRLANHILPT